MLVSEEVKVHLKRRDFVGGEIWSRVHRSTLEEIKPRKTYTNRLQW